VVEESTGKSRAEILLPDDALNAALAAAAQNPARPVEDIPTGYKPVVAEGTGASPGSFEEAAKKWDADPDFAWALPANSNNKPQVAELFSNRDDADLETLEAQQRVAIGEIEQAISQTDDDDNRSKLRQVLRELNEAKTPAAISAALTSANATLNREGVGGGKAAGGDGGEAAQSWRRIGLLNQAITKDLEELHSRGLIGDEEFERLRRERARLDRMDVNDPERLRGEQAYNRSISAAADRAGEAARDNGDSGGKAAADRMRERAQEVERELERRLQRRTENERTRSESTDTTHNGPTSGGRLIIASSEANVASLGDLPNGTNATSARGPSGGPLERV
jgi:hypothetical protein